MEDNTLNINVTIVDRSYPLKIRRADEERVRKAANRINDTVAEYQKLYGKNNDGQDFLAMAILQFATKLIEFEEKNDTLPIVDKLRNIDDLLANFLETENNTRSNTETKHI